MNQEKSWRTAQSSACRQANIFVPYTVPHQIEAKLHKHTHIQANPLNMMPPWRSNVFSNVHLQIYLYVCIYLYISIYIYTYIYLNIYVLRGGGLPGRRAHSWRTNTWSPDARPSCDRRRNRAPHIAPAKKYSIRWLLYSHNVEYKKSDSVLQHCLWVKMLNNNFFPDEIISKTDEFFWILKHSKCGMRNVTI